MSVRVTYDNKRSDEKMKLIYLLSILSFSKQIDANLADYDFQEELFASGSFRPEDKRKNATLKYLSSSTEDLVLLFKAEKELFREILKVFESVDVKTQELINKYKEVIDFEDSTEAYDYVYHPVNSFHLLQRTTKWIPKLVKSIPNLSFKFAFPASFDANVGAANGLADLLEHYGMDPMEISQGKVTDYQTGKVFMANSKMSSMEILKVATAAKTVKYYDDHVRWCKAALEMAKLEKRDKKYLSNIKKMITKAKAQCLKITYKVSVRKFGGELVRKVRM